MLKTSKSPCKTVGKVKLVFGDIGFYNLLNLQIDQLRIYSTSLQILRLCGYHTYKDSLNRWDSFADTAYESYRRSAVQANKENSPIKDRESIDMFGLLAAHYYYDFAIEHKSIQPLLTSLNILHEILNDNCHNYHAKLLCIKLYHFLGKFFF